MNNTQRALNAIKWIDELATTEAKQGKKQLGDDEVGYCCLAIGCLVHDIEFDAGDGTETDLIDVVGINSDAGCYRETSGITKPGKCAGEGTACLAELNDVFDFDFKDIAERLRTKPRRYFKGTVGAMVAKHYRDAA